MLSVRSSVLRSAALNWAANYATPRNIGQYFGSTAMEMAIELLWSRQRHAGDLTALLADRFAWQGAAVVDVGASWGLFTHHLSRRVAKEGAVFAFEPHPANSVVLQKLADKRSNVHFRPVAVSDAAGTAAMQVPRHHNRLVTAQSSLAHGFAEQTEVSVETIRVPTVRLDDEIDAAKRIDFAKIDVEGHELAVLRGAASILRTWMPPILIEIEQRHLPVPIEDVFHELQNIGYHLYYIDGLQLRAIDQFDLERDQLSKLTPNQFQPFSMPDHYVSNFCAVPDPEMVANIGRTTRHTDDRG
jgi:FkbM family methyltransferase